MNSTWRWIGSILLVTTGSVAALIFLDASSSVGTTITTTLRQAGAVQEDSGVASRSATYVASNFTFSSAIQLTRPPIPATLPLKEQDIEPEVKTDIFGNIYVAAIHGVSGGVDLWKSTDKGATFFWLGEPDGAQDKCNVQNTLPCSAGAGGGDESIDVSSGGYLYISSLYLGGTTVSTSFDGGMGGVLPGQAWQVNPNANGNPPVPVNDRQWLAAYGPQTVYMTFDQAPAPGPLWFVKSTDAGKTWSVPMMLTGAEGIDRSGNVAVDPYNGNIYTTYQPRALVGTTVVSMPNQINLLRSIDGGATWATSTAYTGPAGTSVENAFVVLAVDRGGNVHMAFTRSSGTTSRTNAHVFLMSSTDQGATWLPPVQVDSGINTQSTVMPWIAAGSSGVVDVTWYGSSSTSPDAAPFDWHVFFAQTTNALAASPTFKQVLATSDQVHNDAICSQEDNCTGTTRTLGEYYTLTVDPDGNANIAFVDSIHNCTASNCHAYTWFTKQTSGVSAYTPPAPPGPATFAPTVVVRFSGGTAEPNAWVDSHNCIYGGSIPGPIAFKSEDSGTSFTTKAAAVGVGLHGADFDIKTLPQATGARPDEIYIADLGISNVHIGKSTDGGATYTQPGTNGLAGEVEVSTDRMWLAGDRGVPSSSDQTIYMIDHEFVSEEIRFLSLTNDTAWSPFTSGTTNPELVLPPTSTLPNTNVGPVFVLKPTHNVFGLFAASSTTTNTMAPPFGKMMNVWGAVGAPPAAAGLAPGPFTNHPIFKGLIDSPVQAPSPAPTISPGAATYGNHCGNLFPSGAADSAGNVYAVWATNSCRANTTQANGSPSTTFDVWFAASHDGGQNFYGPWRVSSGTGTSVMPWIAAGDSGRVDIVWYQSRSVAPPLIADPTTPGTLTGGPNEMPAGSAWHVMFGQSLNANSREPVFRVSQASDHSNHTGSISTGGLTGSSDRSLLDFFQVAIGPDGLANISYADNRSGGLHISYARQNGGPIAVTSPIFTTCLLGPPVPTSVVSRKTHGSVGTFDVDLLLSGTPGIECRTSGANGDHQVVFTFAVPVTVSGGASVSSGIGNISSFSVNGPIVTVNLTGVANAQTITITLTRVSDGTYSSNVSVPMGVLIGDVNASGVVTSGDTNLCKAQALQPVTSANFRNDINASGSITTGDVNIIKQNALTQLPP